MAAPLQALLLAAGIGTRLRPLTDVLPKCLMPINGRPLLDYWLDSLTEAGFTDIVVNLHHHADLVRAHVERGPHARSVTLSFEAELLGTAGTLLHHKSHFSCSPILLAHSDNLTLFSPARFWDAHLGRPAGTVMTMMTFETDAPTQCGIVKLDAGGVATELHEKSANPPGNLANAAVYIVEPEVTAFLEGLGKSVIDFSTEVLPNFLGQIHTFHNSIYHRDIGTVASLAQAQLEFPCAVALFESQSVGDRAAPGMFGEFGSETAERFLQNVQVAFRSKIGK
jgi:mannose-1-phosphate guanylyltransferase